MIVLDEAWKIASDEKSDAIMIVREGRKYQFGLIVASQNPTDIHESIFSNVGTNFILRIKFQKFLDYIQGSLSFSNFIRSEISKFGVGQAAVEMAFQTSIRFPETFVLEKIYGEEPLYSYTIDMSDILTQAELAANLMAKSYEFEKSDLRNKFIEYNIGSDEIDSIFNAMDQNERSIKMLDLVNLLRDKNITLENIIAFLKSLSIEDEITSRIISRSKT
jgi:Predicted ATPase